MQWGVTNRENCGSCFPLTYSVPYAVIAEEHHLTETATGYDGSFMTTRLTTRGFSYRTESTGYGNAIMFVVFGIQQWGHTNTSSDAAITIKFPITFSTVYCVSISKTSDNTSYAAMLRTCIQSFSTSQFVTRGGYQTYCDWVAVGKT